VACGSSLVEIIIDPTLTNSIPAKVIQKYSQTVLAAYNQKRKIDKIRFCKYLERIRKKDFIKNSQILRNKSILGKEKK
jgi:hypothetical protein